ncbi:hypothetical protein BUALT_Bualt04G0076700 [Buddleja alternifolia]|uniref:DNA-directed RNA polymerase III subunit RPC5 n=1 Tax=Buddleja alternifolia TaxID=168488 RepID=A0AAV6XXW4_9LAMI|nr:hypothetical protein BUALT_Bualt04G0076700 [Buddleja alternifolia]
MADMDLDELLDGPTQAPTRPARFAPKGSKFKPRPKTESSESLTSSTSDSSQSLPLPKKEELGIEPDTKPQYTSDATEMDIEVKPGEISHNVLKEEEIDDLMEREAKEPEDEVVREIDVYFSPSLDPSARLYVLQYPVRPVWRPYDLDERCEEVRVKPPSAELEVDLSIDVDSKNYDSGTDPRLQMKKQTLTTKWKSPHSSRYAVGVLTGNKARLFFSLSPTLFTISNICRAILHLNPIHAVVQLRPSMEHLDSRESKRKPAVSSNVEAIVKAEVPKEGKPSGASKKPAKIPEQDKDSEEGWVPLKYHGSRSKVAAGYLQKMMTQEGSPVYFSMSSCDYLNSLCPGASNDSFSSKGPSKRFLLTLPLKDRFKIWLVEGPPVHRFDALKHLAPDESVEEVLGVLQEHGRLVQGLWVPRSSLVYETDQGIEVLARDYILLLFSKNVTINSSQLPQRPQLAKAMKDVLSLLAVERPAFNDWKLKELPDMSFTKLYPSIVKKQEEEWESLEKKINDLFGGRNGPGIKASSKSNTINNSATSKSSNKVATRTSNGATSISAMSEEVRDAVTKALQKLFKNIKVCSFQQISQRLRDMAVSESARSTGFAREAVAAANSIDAFPDELQAIISQVAVNIHGLCVPKSSPDHPQYDAFRKVVIDLFVAEGPNTKLKKAPIIEAAKMELKRDIPNMEYQKVLQELCISQGSAWVLRSGDGNPKH